MKTLFNKTLNFNYDGGKIHDEFEGLVKDFIKQYDLNTYNPVELRFVLQQVMDLQMEGLYLDMASDLYMESGASLN